MSANLFSSRPAHIISQLDVWCEKEDLPYCTSIKYYLGWPLIYFWKTYYFVGQTITQIIKSKLKCQDISFADGSNYHMLSLRLRFAFVNESYGWCVFSSLLEVPYGVFLWQIVGLRCKTYEIIFQSNEDFNFFAFVFL